MLNFTKPQPPAPQLGVESTLCAPIFPWTRENGGDVSLMRLTRDTAWWNGPVSGAGDWADIRSHLLTLYQIVVHGIDRRRPARVLEVGTREGISTMALLYAMYERGQPDGCLESIECDERNALITEALVTSSMLNEKVCWTLLRQRSTEAAQNLGAAYDLIFIDADHSYDAVMADLQLLCARVRRGGWLVLHDPFVDADCMQPSDVMRALLDSPDVAAMTQAPGSQRFILPWGHGLAVIRRGGQG